MRTKSPSQAEKILTVAARLFATHRFHETRMEDIAAAAEVGKGTLYRYFKDKDELYQALLARAAEQLSRLLREEVSSSEPSCSSCCRGPRARLEAVIAVIVGYFDDNPHLFDLIHHAEVVKRPQAEFPWGQTRQEMLHLVGDLLQEGNRTGEFAIADPSLTTLLLLGGLRAVIRFDGRSRHVDLVPSIIDAFVGPVHQKAEGRRQKAE